MSAPMVQLLSNGSYHVMLTRAGAGYSRWKDLAVTRWREDAIRDRGDSSDICQVSDPWGSFCYIRDLASGDTWSSTHAPMLRQADQSEATFTPGSAAFSTFLHGIQAQTEIVVAPQDDVEVRRVRLTNRSAIRRLIAVTSYAEVVLASAAADAAHPAFSKLFVETEVLHAQQAILCSRRPRAPADPTPWLFQLLNPSQPPAAEVSYETDRMRFTGRGRSSADPQAMDEDGPLSGSAGAVLDAVAAIRCALALEPGATVSVDFVTGAGGSRQACLGLIDKYRDQAMADQALAAAPARARNVLATLQASQPDGELYTRLAGSVIYVNPDARAPPDILAGNRLGQQGLWAHGISGDLPIVLLRIAGAADIVLLRQAAQAQAWWRLHGLAVDLVVLCEGQAAGQPALQQHALQCLAVAGGGGGPIDKPGGVFVRLANQLPPADHALLQTVARAVLSGAAGTLAQQLDQIESVSLSAAMSKLPADADVHAEPGAGLVDGVAAPQDLLFDNGTGGFSADGREYVITSARGRMTPLPWVNALANPSFGTLISESGSACTWSENAQVLRLTPWSNDPVGDPNTDALYVRDEDSGHTWSPTLLPCGGTAPYVTRHGFGYSVFEHDERGIGSELVVYVAHDEPLKFMQLTLRNASGRARRLSVTGYLQWVLGDEAAKTRMFVYTEFDAPSGALFARNSYHTTFGGRVAFFAADAEASADTSHCADRAAFLGRDGSLRSPAALQQARLCGSVGAGLDPCAALRIAVDLAPGQTREIGFRLGAAGSAEEARRLVQRWHGPAAARQALAAVKQFWQQTLGAVQIKTPDRSLDVLANGWLVYQVLACRLWARTAFYQSSGAYGFRDQLQDVMALVHATPALVREHLLRSAARQFPEGDVQHWWHPPSGGGVRTRCSDDYLWLPMATCRYVTVTGDSAVLDEPVYFLQGRALGDGQESAYDQPAPSDEVASLYQHCVRAIEHGWRFGEHGLPLMGSGDWSDGMNLVGAAGKGESVWLGFFLCAVLAQFEPVARQRGDAVFAERCSSESARLRAAIEQHGWDGAWYRRAWFDDGSPLGASANAECRIDSIAQSWAVLSGAADAQRARAAMAAVDAHLVRRDAALIQLLDPAFDHSKPSPGYVQGYVRGVRENGGQYTHAAVWVAMAFAALGDAERAWEMFTLLDPTRHAQTADAVARYKTEPYVMAGDVYALAPHAGRGGWSWYTGAAGWMVQFIVESLLGLKVEGDTLQLTPCVPAHWPSFELHYRYRRTPYHITVRQTPGADGVAGLAGLTLDGTALPGSVMVLIDDGLEHRVDVQWSARLPAGART